MSSRSPSRALLGIGTVITTLALLLAACTSSGKPGASGTGGTGGTGGTVGNGGETTTADEAQQGGVVKYAEEPGGAPNYLMPVLNAAYNSSYNYNALLLMWPVLYNTYATKPDVDYSRSLGNKPIWSDGNRTATINMKHYVWSDGEPVTARDLVFFINLCKAIGPLWAGYAPGSFPLNLTNYSATGKYQLTMTFTHAYNPTYALLTYLTELIPIPQHAWDKTSMSGKIGNYDLTKAGAKAVYKFLDGEAKQKANYATNPLWKVVDGPWQLKTFGGDSSPDVFVPNPHFSGHHPYLDEFQEIPFTSDTAEFNDLRAGDLSVGAVPAANLPSVDSLLPEGYTTAPSDSWSTDFAVPNLVNPDRGAVLRQLYIRQALEHTIDQPTMIETFMHGKGVPTYGPVPTIPRNNQFISDTEKDYYYPYSIDAAIKLLRDHHWKINPGGTDVCLKGGPDGCGAGIKTGTPLTFLTRVTSGGVIELKNRLWKSDAAKAGINLQLQFQPFNVVNSNVNFCDPKKEADSPECTWQIGEWGGGGYGLVPTGEYTFLPGAAINVSQYNFPELNNYIRQSLVADDLEPFYKYEDFVVKNALWFWLPKEQSIVAYKSNLHGDGITGQFASLDPEYWYYTND